MKLSYKVLAVVTVMLTLSANLALAKEAAPASDSVKSHSHLSSDDTEALLQRIRVNGKRQAADAAYQLSKAAAGREDLTGAYELAMESIQLVPGVADYHGLAATLANALKDYKAAVIHGRSKLDLVRRKYGDEAPETASALQSLGVFQANNGCFDEARSILNQSLAIRRSNFGEHHPDVIVTINQLAMIAHKQHQPDEVENNFKLALKLLKETYGDSTPNAAIGETNLAEFYLLQERYEEAESLYQQVLRIVEQTQSPQIQLSAMALSGLGHLYLAQQRWDDAQRQFETMDDLMVKELGESHPYVKKARQGLKQVAGAREHAASNQALFHILTSKLSEQLQRIAIE